MRRKNVDKCSNLSCFLPLFFLLYSTSTLIYTTLENEKKSKKKKKEREMFVLRQHTLSKQRYLHLTRANTNENSLPCGTYGLVLFTTVYLSDTISSSDIYKKLETQSSRGRRSNARVTFMRDLTRKNALFPAIDRDK